MIKEKNILNAKKPDIQSGCLIKCLFSDCEQKSIK